MVSKYLLILVVLLAAIFIWRSNRKAALKVRKASEQRAKVIDMQPCRWCGVHIPSNDAVQGRHGPYCSVAHRLKAEP
ncbi:MAG: PP0621 family protein [Cytophagales bacterium]|nr:PP0621 family protein [Cytophagales bacterium]